MFDLVMIEKDIHDRNVSDIGAHYWERMSQDFQNKSGKELTKKWNNLKAVYKFHHDEIMRYPSGGIEPETYFGKWPSKKEEKLFEYENMDELM